MEPFKIVPQAFYDLIARVVPGAFAIFSYFNLFDPEWVGWHRLINGVLGRAEDGRGYPTIFTALAFLFLSYVVGHLISPLVKRAQDLGHRSQRLFAGLRLVDPFAKPAGQAADYDLLRVVSPEAGAVCGKLRAEYTMYYGLAVVFLASAFAYPFSFMAQAWPWWPVAPLLAASFLMESRGVEGEGAFGRCVERYAAHWREHSK
jgi:hypothetical protein